MCGCASSIRQHKAKIILNSSLAKADPKQSNCDENSTIFNKDGLKKKLSTDFIKKYIEWEKIICSLEKQNLFNKYESKLMFADEAKKNVDQLEAVFRELKKQTDKEKSDIEYIEQPSIKTFFIQQGTWQKRYEKKHKDFIEAQNRQEKAKKELQNANIQYDQAANVANICKQQCDSLTSFYRKQNNMFGIIIGKKFASPIEKKLSSELDVALEWQQRIIIAKFKWSNGRILLVYASTQLMFGISRWKRLVNIAKNNTRMRYFAAADARNNFIAASQNIQSCRVYLDHVKFPYVTNGDITSMELALQSSFNNIKLDENIQKTQIEYENTYRNTILLVQWFDKVLNDIIIKDLNNSNNQVSQIQKKMRLERFEVMQKTIRENLNCEIEVFLKKSYSDTNDEDNLLIQKQKEKMRL